MKIYDDEGNERQTGEWIESESITINLGEKAHERRPKRSAVSYLPKPLHRAFIATGWFMDGLADDYHLRFSEGVQSSFRECWADANELTDEELKYGN